MEFELNQDILDNFVIRIASKLHAKVDPSQMDPLTNIFIVTILSFAYLLSP